MRRLVLLLAPLALAACASRTTRGLATVGPGEGRVRLGPSAPEREGEETIQVRGPWQVVPGGGFTRLAEPDDGRRAPPGAVEAAPAPEPAVAPAPAPRPVLPVPRRRAAVSARPAGQPQERSAQELAREHFLDYPTRIRASRLTLYCPAALAPGVHLTGATLDSGGEGRRIASGGARLILRELTLEGDRIVFQVRAPGEEDLQVMARGGVHFVSEARGHVVRHEGLRSLLLTNDQVVPLR